MQVKDFIGDAVAKVGLAPADAVPTRLWNRALAMFNRIYEDVWHSYPFRDEKMAMASMSVAAGTDIITLDQQIDAVRAMRHANGSMLPVNELVLSNWGGTDAFADTGTPGSYFNLNDAPVSAQPAAGTKIKLYSASAADTTQYVRVFGTTTAGDVFEDILLAGTGGSAASTNTFTALLELSKPRTAGHIAVKNEGGTVTYGTIYSWDMRPCYRRIRLWPIPDAALTLYMECVRRFRPLVNQYDTIPLRHVTGAMFNYLVAELYEDAGEGEKAGTERQKAVASMEVVLNRQEMQDQTDRRFALPAYSMFDDGGGVSGSVNTDSKTAW
jgi:hypothetical protein